MTRCEFHLMAAIISARNDVSYLARRASISNWNSNCKCAHWKSTLNLLCIEGMMEGDARGAAEKRSAVQRRD